MTDDTDVVKAEAARLKAIYLDRKRQDPTLNQEKIAEAFGWAGQSAVSQYMTAKIPLNLPALLKFAKFLRFVPSEVSQRLTGETYLLEEFSKQPSIGPVRAKAALEQIKTYGTSMLAGEIPSSEISPAEIWDDCSALRPEEVALPFFVETECSSGNGSAVRIDGDGKKLRFSQQTLQRKNITPERAACAPVTGNSMEPVLLHGSIVAMNLEETSVQDGKMYVIDHDGQLRVKLLYETPGKGLRLRSYNQDEHPDERYDSAYLKEHIRIMGRVWWYSVLL